MITYQVPNVHENSLHNQLLVISYICLKKKKNYVA